MMTKVWEFLKEEDGQTSTEYILLLAVVALIVMRFRSVAVERLEQLTESVFNQGNDILEDLGP